MAPKRQAAPDGSEEAAVEEVAEPVPKAARTEALPEAPKPPEKPEELEADAPVDKRKVQTTAVTFEGQDTTLNVIPSHSHRVLAALSDGGLHYLVAAARGSVGVKAGRYMYEVKIMEVLTPYESNRHSRPNMSKQAVRLGFSVPGSSLFLGDSEESVCFDAEGFFVVNQTRKPSASKFGRNQVVGLLLNLDPKSANANTVSLFVDGVRVSQPMPLPDGCKGKTLCPHVSFRNLTLHMNFGPEPMAPLPFTCRMLQGAAQADTVVTPPPKKTKDGKFEVVFPVGVPDEGTFHMLDQFMADNPHFVELSDRKLVEWAARSGLPKPKPNFQRTSNDKPDNHFGLQALDELQMRRIIASIAPLVPRNYIVMEVRSNLVKAERMELLKRFSGPHFKRIAKVAIGEPPASYKDKVMKLKLKEKQDKLDLEYKQRQLEKERKKQIMLKKREMIEKRKALQEQVAKVKAEEDAKKKAAAEEEAAAKAAAAAEAKAAAAAAAAAAEAEGAEGEKKAEGEEGEKKEGAEVKVEVKTEVPEEKKEADGDAKMEDVKEEEKKEDDKDEVKEEEEEDEPPPQAELTEDEKKEIFKKLEFSDIRGDVLDSCFHLFALPEKEDGFHELRFDWQDQEMSSMYLKKWILQRKLTARLEDLQPSSWFYERLTEWQKVLQEWQLKQKNYKQDLAAKEAAKKAAEEKPAQAAEGAQLAEQAEAEEGGAVATQGEEKKTEEGEKKTAEAAAEEKKEESDKVVVAEEKKEEKKEEVKAEEKVEEAAEPPKDVFAVEDINDMCNGEPLFANFAFEDWALMGLRFELHLLVRSFRHDVEDLDRPGMTEEHVPFYYNRYYRKHLNVKFFGRDTTNDLTGLVKDTVEFNDNVLATKLEEASFDHPQFVRLTEEARRDRFRRIEAGDDSAKLRFNIMATPPDMGKGGGGGPRVVPAQSSYGNSQQGGAGGGNYNQGGNWGAGGSAGKGGGGGGDRGAKGWNKGYNNSSSGNKGGNWNNKGGYGKSDWGKQQKRGPPQELTM